MADAVQVKVYFSENNGLGGDIDTNNQVLSNTARNLFDNINSLEQAAGEDFYLCSFYKNTSAEIMENFKLWLVEKKRPHDVTLKWGLDPAAEPGRYRYRPWFDANGANFDDTTHTSSLALIRWTISGWFRTSVGYSTEGMIANKGGIGSDTPGQNMNYGVWINASEQIVAGFEESNGTDHNITSPLTYNDGHWHFFVADYSNDSGNLRLFIDDMLTPVASDSGITVTPDNTGTQPFRRGANSRASDRFFNGDIDEVRVWNRASTFDKREALQLFNKPNTAGLVVEKKFGADANHIHAQTIFDKYTAPTSVQWHDVDEEPDDPNFGKLYPTGYFPIWLHLHNEPAAESRVNDSGTFFFEYEITQGGTPSTGGGDQDGSSGGSGGNTTTNSDYKIAIIGDEGCGGDTKAVRDRVKKGNYDLVVSVGDHAYDDPDCWISIWDDIKSIFKLGAMGNHEYDDGGLSDYRAFFGLKSKVSGAYCLTYKFENTFWLIIDSNKDMDPGSDQHDFIKAELARVRKDSSITWRMAVMHHPWYGKGGKHPFNEEDQIDAWQELFDKEGVNFLFVGHNHNWSRSKQIEHNSDDPEDPNIVDSSSPYDGTKGMFEIRSGTAGHDDEDDLYSLGSLSSQPWVGYQNNTHLGFYELVASNNAKTLKGRFVEVGGNTFDTMTVTMP